jgi:hypothetical protein
MTAQEALALIQAGQSAAFGIVATIKAMIRSHNPPAHPDGAPLTEADVDAAIEAAKAPWKQIERTAADELGIK